MGSLSSECIFSLPNSVHGSGPREAVRKTGSFTVFPVFLCPCGAQPPDTSVALLNFWPDGDVFDLRGGEMNWYFTESSCPSKNSWLRKPFSNEDWTYFPEQINFALKFVKN